MYRIFIYVSVVNLDLVFVNDRVAFLTFAEFNTTITFYAYFAVFGDFESRAAVIFSNCYSVGTNIYSAITSRKGRFTVVD